MSLQQETTDKSGSLVSDTVKFFTAHNAQNEEILGKMPTDLKKNQDFRERKYEAPYVFDRRGELNISVNRSISKTKDY